MECWYDTPLYKPLILIYFPQLVRKSCAAVQNDEVYKWWDQSNSYHTQHVRTTQVWKYRKNSYDRVYFWPNSCPKNFQASIFQYLDSVSIGACLFEVASLELVDLWLEPLNVKDDVRAFGLMLLQPLTQISRHSTGLRNPYFSVINRFNNEQIGVRYFLSLLH